MRVCTNWGVKLQEIQPFGAATGAMNGERGDDQGGMMNNYTMSPSKVPVQSMLAGKGKGG